MSPPLARLVVIALLLGAGIVAIAAPAPANELTIYRCTDADGRLALRDTPCRAGERQQTREMQRPQGPPPRPSPPPREVAVPAAAPAPPPRVIVMRTPRPLYECVTPDGEVYTSDTDEGDPRWVPLWTLGYPVVIGGTSLGHRIGAPPPQPPRDRPGVPHRPSHGPTLGLAYAAGTWVRDECHALPQREVCDRLHDRDRELRRQYNSALQGERQRITTQRRGIDARLAADCG